MSATVAAALKKIAVAILTDKKARKVVLGIILGILIILVMPLAAIIAIFNGDINIDANRLCGERRIHYPRERYQHCLCKYGQNVGRSRGFL